MRFSRVFAFVAAALSVSSVTAAPELAPRQLNILNACATVGPIGTSSLPGYPSWGPRIDIVPVRLSRLCSKQMAL